MNSILDGIKVLDWTHYVVGPAGTMLLADFGAEVIHLEEPRGEHGRQWMRYMGVDGILPGGRSIPFEACNRNKKSITVNLSTPAGKEIAYRLVEACDVLVQNMRPGAAEKLGMSYGALSKLNPRLVYVSSTGMGALGSESGIPTTDFIAQAKAGMLQPDPAQEPDFHYPGMGDDVGSLAVFGAALLGLVQRSTTGRGMHLHASQFGALLHAQRWMMSFHMGSGKRLVKHDRHNPPNPLFGWYKCSDSRWLALAIFHPENEWERFCQAIGRSELAADARFTTVDLRQQNNLALVPLLEETFAFRPAAEWEKTMRGASLLGCVINTHDDLPHDPQALANDFMLTMNTPGVGVMPQIGNPIQVEDESGVRPVPRNAAPTVGQNTDAVLSELGYTAQDIVRLRGEGAI